MGNVVPVHVMLAYIQSGGIPPLILNLPAPAALIWYPFNRSVFGSKSKSGRFGEDNNLLPLLGFETPVQSAA